MADLVLTAAKYPNLNSEGYSDESLATTAYNCIAWAFDDNLRWWWPDYLSYWPTGCPREVSVDAFTAMFATLGFTPSDNEIYEQGFKKIALYALAGVPTHASKQIDENLWASKMGKWVDIHHTLRGLEGPHYGQVIRLFKKPINE